jgi:hypothetical protein
MWVLGLRVLGLRVYLGFFLWAVLIVPVYIGAPYTFFIKLITYKKKITSDFWWCFKLGCC